MRHGTSPGSHPQNPDANVGSHTTVSVEDADYKTDMHSLIANIHKIDGEWTRKRRDLSMAVAKSRTNASTKDSVPQQQLESIIKQVDAWNLHLSEIEKKHVTGVRISHSDQVQCKTIINEILKKAKKGNQVKLHILPLHCFAVDHSRKRLCALLLRRTCFPAQSDKSAIKRPSDNTVDGHRAECSFCFIHLLPYARNASLTPTTCSLNTLCS